MMSYKMVVICKSTLWTNRKQHFIWEFKLQPWLPSDNWRLL